MADTKVTSVALRAWEEPFTNPDDGSFTGLLQFDATDALGVIRVSAFGDTVAYVEDDNLLAGLKSLLESLPNATYSVTDAGGTAEQSLHLTQDEKEYLAGPPGPRIFEIGGEHKVIPSPNHGKSFISPLENQP